MQDFHKVFSKVLPPLPYNRCGCRSGLHCGETEQKHTAADFPDAHTTNDALTFRSANDSYRFRVYSISAPPLPLLRTVS